MKTVCIVGAGPAGLVAAKTLTQKGGFDVTIFESTSRVGGMWRAPPGAFGDKCSPDMRTNLSKYTVAFSDLSWASVDLSILDSDQHLSHAAPMFPKAWQVGRYLETYAQKYDISSKIKLKNRVIEAKPSGERKAWEITCIDGSAQQSTHIFDYLIIASGFFDKPGSTFDPSIHGSSPNIKHSSSFRDVSSLTDRAGKIVVIGGGISGSEAAAQAAFQISSLQNSPGKTQSPHTESKIHHIINRPFYCLPRYLPQDPHNSSIQDFNLSPTFLPNDLALYNLSRRGGAEISAAIAPVPADKAKKGHEYLRSVIGGDQRDLGFSELVYKPEHMQFPGYTGITDTYSEFVRSGVIVPVQGWVDVVQQDSDNNSFSITLKHKAPWSEQTNEGAKEHSTITDISGIIEATGYQTNLDFLDSETRHLLSFDSSCPRVPFLLTRGSILASGIPSLGFVGFYEGPYWGVMEMQARVIANTWSDQDISSFTPIQSTMFSHDDAKQMREAIQQKSLQVPQFWMMDYIGLVEEFSRATGFGRDDSVFGGQTGPAFPARYPDTASGYEASGVSREVVDLIQASRTEARFVAAAAFRGMQGVWNLNRKIDSRNTASPGGVFLGTANFHPRVPTSPLYSSEYLYIENGTFKMDNGLSFPATRRYVYRYDESKDQITAWFADDDGVSAGSLFNTWKFEAPYDAYHGWIAKGHHWCDPDTYKNLCEFRFRGASLNVFGITYEVHGPNKDYSHESWYERPQKEYV